MIGKTFGPNCEVVLHDLRHPQNSVVAVANGTVTGRVVGQGIRDFVKILRSPNFSNDVLANYQVKEERQGHIKSSTALLRDTNGDLIGALCINFDFTPLQDAVKQLAHFTSVQPINRPAAPSKVSPDILQSLEQLIASTIADSGVDVKAMRKEEKLRMIQFLEERGAFMIRGSLERVAKELQVTRHSMYKYLEEIRRK
jgi:predicted transcriptional regulator YheO